MASTDPAVPGVKEYDEMKAKLVLARMEIGSPKRSRKYGMQPSYRWVDCYQVSDPQGRELQPYMRKREAVAYCKSQGWEYEVVR